MPNNLYAVEWLNLRLKEEWSVLQVCQGYELIMSVFKGEMNKKTKT